MKNIVKYCTLTLLAASPLFTLAQESVVSQNVNVIKDFTPEIKGASKLSFRPQQEPPTVIDFSNINYNVLYRSEPYSPVINPLSMPTYERSAYNTLYNGYASLMIGAPLQSRASLYYTTGVRRDLIMGVGFNNRGFYNKLKNDYGDRVSALNMSNDLSLMLQYRIDNLEIDFDALVTHHLFNRYGYANPFGSDFTTEQYTAAQESMKQYFLRGYANIAVGMPESDHNLFSGKFRGFFSFISDKHGYSEQITHAGLSASTRKLNDIHRFFLDMEYLILLTNNKMVDVTPVVLPTQPFDKYSNLLGQEMLPYSTLFVHPKYTLNYRKLDIEVGAKMTFCVGNKWYGDSKPAINPVAKVQVRLLDNMLIPYVSLDGEYQYNTYYNLSALNPFVQNGLTAPNSNVNTVVLGFKGDVKSKFQYDAFLGYERTKNKVMFVNSGYGNTFSTAIANLDAFIAGASFKYDITRNIYVNAAWRYEKYPTKTNEEMNTTDRFAYGIPAHKANLKVGYEQEAHKYGAFLNINVQSKRECIAVFNDYGNVLQFNEIGTKADLSVGGYYQLNKRLAFNAEINNILGSELYEYNFYRGIGFNALIGVSYLF